MNAATPLSPAEALVLLDTKGATGREAFKVTVMSLLAQGAIAIKEESRKGMFRTTKTTRIFPGNPLAGLPAHVQAVLSLIGSRGIDGVEMKSLATTAQKTFGPGLYTFKTSHVLPALLQRGLVKSEQETRMLFFKVASWPLTAAGMMEKNRLEAVIARARMLPELLQTDKAEAAAIVLAAGGVLLLIPQLKPYYGQMAALRAPPLNDHGSGDSNWANLGSSGSATGTDSLDFAGFDSSALDTLDSGMASFDASFDSSFSDGGGGDSGGGDSGGGGGDGGGGG